MKTPFSFLLLTMFSVAKPSSGEPLAFPEDLGALRIHGGINEWQGNQTSRSSTQLSYSGPNFTGFGLDGRLYPTRSLGIALSAERLGFSLMQQGQKLGAGGIFQGTIGPSARVGLGLVQLEVVTGYGYAQVLSFSTPDQPVQSAGRRQSIAVGGVLSTRLPWSIFAELSGNYFIPLSASDGRGHPADALSFSGGITLSRGLGNWGSTRYGIALQYKYLSDRLTSNDGIVAQQNVSQVAVAFQLSWPNGLPVSPPLATGSVLISVLDDQTRQPLGNIRGTVIGASSDRSFTTESDGTVLLEGVPLGSNTMLIVDENHLPSFQKISIVEGELKRAVVGLKKSPNQLGTLHVNVIDQASHLPVVRALAARKGISTDNAGNAVLENLPLGPVQLEFTAPNYRPSNEAALISAGARSEMTVTMVHQGAVAPGFLTGLIRNSRDGRPVSAKLELTPGANNQRVNAQGKFKIRLQPGAYKVLVTAQGFSSQTKEIQILEGSLVILELELHPL